MNFNLLQLNLHNSIAETTILTPSFIQPIITQSKLASCPYMPKNEYPIVDEHGLPMLLLAQLNFAEFSAPKNFPNEGILQIFISQNCYERYTIKQSKSLFNIRYYPTIKEYSITPADYLSHVNLTRFPIKYAQLLLSYSQLEPVSATDYRLPHYVDPYFLTQLFTIG